MVQDVGQVAAVATQQAYMAAGQSAEGLQARQPVCFAVTHISVVQVVLQFSAACSVREGSPLHERGKLLLGHKKNVGLACCDSLNDSIARTSCLG